MKVPKKKWVQQVLYLNNVIIQEMTATYTSINQCKEVKIVVHLNFSILVKNSDKHCQTTFWNILFENSGDTDQMPHSTASDLDLQCLPITQLGFSRLQ